MAVFVAEVDALLKGQLRAMAGLLIAVQRGLLPEEYLDVALSDQTLVTLRCICSISFGFTCATTKKISCRFTRHCDAHHRR